MGASSGTVADPLVPLRPPTLTRNVGGTATDNGTVVCSQTLFDSDATFNGMGAYPAVSGAIEGAPNHDCAHGFIGGYGFGSGQISSLSTAAQDPVFFMLHANVDRQWANWQRQGADPDRLDPVSVYGADSSHPRIDATMSPWDGATSLAPWNGAGAATNKTSKDRSVVFPPIYDTAPLRIPQLQPGQSVVVEIPWYPPDVNDYNCAGQAGHFCLLARIETSTTSPFGMTTLEGTNVGTNTRNNNDIAWKNVTIIDNLSDPPLLRMITGTTVRNIFDREAIFEIALHDRTEERRFLLPELARVSLGLPEGILERLRGRQAELGDLKLVRDEKTRRALLQVAGKEPRFALAMKPGETFVVELVVEVLRDEVPKALLAEPFHYDIEQRLDARRDSDDPRFGRRNREVGGVRFTFDFARALKEREPRAEGAAPGGLRLEVAAPRRKVLTAEGAAPAPVEHLSVGEPVQVSVRPEGRAELRALTLEIDGRRVADEAGTARLSETVSFDEPGVHTILARAVDGNGDVVESRTRILVSKDIPPNVLIRSPESGAMFKVGETIRVVAEAAPAFRREVAEMSLYVKEGDLIETGLNLVRSPNYEPVATAEGAGPHELAFTPERPGMYMLQLGAVDDQGIVGVSGHAMIMVHE